MELSIQDIEMLMTISRLSLTEEEKETYRQELSQRASFVARLREAEGADEDCLPPPASLDTLREDQVGESLPRELLLRSAPVCEGEFFSVPRALEEL